METYKIFTSSDLCFPDHTVFMKVDDNNLCRECIHQEIIDYGIHISHNPYYLSVDIENAVYDCMENEYSDNDPKVLEFVKIGLAEKVLKKFFPERFGNEKYCQTCGDHFYHDRHCSCG